MGRVKASRQRRSTESRVFSEDNPILYLMNLPKAEPEWDHFRKKWEQSRSFGHLPFSSSVLASGNTEGCWVVNSVINIFQHTTGPEFYDRHTCNFHKFYNRGIYTMLDRNENGANNFGWGTCGRHLGGVCTWAGSWSVSTCLSEQEDGERHPRQRERHGAWTIQWIDMSCLSKCLVIG